MGHSMKGFFFLCVCVCVCVFKSTAKARSTVLLKLMSCSLVTEMLTPIVVEEGTLTVILTED